MSGRRARTTAAALLVAALVGAVVAGLMRLEIRTDLNSFLPADDPAASAHAAVTETFGADPIVILIEADESTDVLSPDALTAVVQLEGQLAGLDGVGAVYGPGTLLNQLAGRAQDFLAQLFGRRDAEVEQARQNAAAAGGTPAEIDAAGAAVMAEFDARYGPLLVAGMPGGLPTLTNANFIRTVVLNDDDSPRGQWQFVVPDRDVLAVSVRPSESIDATASANLVDEIDRVVGESAVAGTTMTVTGASVVVAAMSERAMRDVPILGALAIVLVGACFMSATWIRRSRRLAPMAATLAGIATTLAVLGWLGIPVSLAIVAFLPVLLGLGCYYPTYLLMGASTRTFMTVVASSAAAFATLTLAPLPLVRDLGLTMAVGVVLAGAFAWPIRAVLGDSFADDVTAARLPMPVRRTGWRVVAALMVAVAVFGWVRLDDLALRTDVEAYAAGLPELDDARHVERAIGSAGEVTIVIRGIDALSPEAYDWTRAAWERVVVEHGDSLRPIISPPALLTFLGEEPSAEQIDAAYRLMPQYLLTSVVSVDRSTAVMSFGVRLDDLGSLSQTLAAVEEQLPTAPPGYEVEITGLPVVLAQGEALISADRYWASVAGIVAAGAVLALGLGYRRDALRGMAAAGVATGIGFAVLAVTNGHLDPVTATLGALTAAVGCEFTVVLAEAVRGNRRLLSAVPLVAATSALGYGVLLASGLPAVRSFGVFLGGSVLVSVASAWVVVAATVRPVEPVDEAAEGDDEIDLTAAGRQKVMV